MRCASRMNGRHAAGNMKKHALTTPLHPFNPGSREAPWCKKRSPSGMAFLRIAIPFYFII
jgi:hypothetical protein